MGEPLEVQEDQREQHQGGDEKDVAGAAGPGVLFHINTATGAWGQGLTSDRRWLARSLRRRQDSPIRMRNSMM